MSSLTPFLRPHKLFDGISLLRLVDGDDAFDVKIEFLKAEISQTSNIKYLKEVKKKTLNKNDGD
jgi:hypothetical protein